VGHRIHHCRLVLNFFLYGSLFGLSPHGVYLEDLRDAGKMGIVSWRNLGVSSASQESVSAEDGV